jgi:FkbM family methyltransferase
MHGLLGHQGNEGNEVFCLRPLRRAGSLEFKPPLDMLGAVREDFFSQSGEDFLLSRYFTGSSGFFVEIGCIDGKRFSNTYHFEQRGWNGLCIEAHQDYIPMLKANRPRSSIVHCAVAERDLENAPFYANARGSLSSLDPSSEERWKRDYAQYFSGFQQQTVPQRTLTSIFQEHKVGRIDILSLDIEGYEVQALQGLNFSLFQPSVIVVESDSPEHEQKLGALTAAAGYSCALRYAGNLYYSVLPDFQAAVAEKHFPGVPLTSTQHPLDKDGDTVRVVDIDTREKKPSPDSSKPHGLAQLFGLLKK